MKMGLITMTGRGIVFACLTALTLGGVVKSDEKAKATQSAAPEKFLVQLETTKGNVVIEVNRNWAPNGVDRFHELVTSGFYNDAGFFRVVPGFVVQFGLAADPEVQKKWTDATLKDDPVVESNKRGTVTFAMRGKNTRTTQLFINYGDNSRLDSMGFAPFGRVIEGMDVVDKINSEYGQSPDQGEITQRGSAYLKAAFPNMDYIKKATVIPAKE